MVQRDNGRAFSEKEKRSADSCRVVNEPRMRYAKGKKPVPEITFIWNVQHKRIYRDRKEMSSCQGLGERGRERGKRWCQLRGIGFLLAGNETF